MRFAAYSGLRAGEIAGLNVGDLDLLTAVPRFTPGGEPAGQFCTRPDVELHVYVPQVVLHRLRAEEEGCSGFLGGVPPPKHPRDLQFLRGQPVEGTVAAAYAVSPVERSSLAAWSAQGVGSEGLKRR